MANVLIQQIQLPVPGVEQMQVKARKEGYNFLETLVQEWLSGKNRFDAAGEILCDHVEEGFLVAVGGLNCDPFLADPTVCASGGFTSDRRGTTEVLEQRFSTGFLMSHGRTFAA